VPVTAVTVVASLLEALGRVWVLLWTCDAPQDLVIPSERTSVSRCL